MTTDLMADFLSPLCVSDVKARMIPVGACMSPETVRTIANRNVTWNAAVVHGICAEVLSQRRSLELEVVRDEFCARF
jgi:hypothetical protein